MNETSLYGRRARTHTANTRRVRRHIVGKRGCNAKPPLLNLNGHFLNFYRNWENMEFWTQVAVILTKL